MRLCDERDNCHEYDSGSNLPPNHHVRHTVQCAKFKKGECELLKGQSCLISKGKTARKIKGELGGEDRRISDKKAILD